MLSRVCLSAACVVSTLACGVESVPTVVNASSLEHRPPPSLDTAMGAVQSSIGQGPSPRPPDHQPALNSPGGAEISSPCAKKRSLSRTTSRDLLVRTPTRVAPRSRQAGEMLGASHANGPTEHRPAPRLFRESSVLPAAAEGSVEWTKAQLRQN